MSSDGINRTCTECEIVIYDVPYSDEGGSGYLNPKYCPICGCSLQTEVGQGADDE